MQEIARRALGDSCTIVDVHEPAFTEQLRTASEVVLLWPDAIGNGWWQVERRVLHSKPRDASVFALTGRHRRYELSSRTLAGFRARRFLEHLWIGEAVLAASLVAVLPFLVIWDLARGHK